MVRVVDTSSIRVSYRCISCYFTVTIILNRCSWVTRRSASVLKVGVVDVEIRILSHLKEELAWAIDKRLWIISTIMLFKNTKELKETKE